MSAGIYRIVNQATNRTYIGSGVRIAKRLHDHKKTLIDGTHCNRHLQRAWNKYGEQSFTFEPLLLCDVHARKIREQQFMDAYISHGMALYNQRPSAESREGFRCVVSDETRAKMRLAWKSRPPVSAESRMKMSVAATGHVRSPETRTKMGLAKRGKPKSLEHRAKLSQMAKQQWNAEFREKFTKSRTGVPWSIARRLANDRKHL